MNRPPRDSDARKIVDNAFETLSRLRAAHAHYSSLRIAIEARMVDGLAGTDYDGGPRSSDDTTPVERAAMLRERDTAHNDLENLYRAIRRIEAADNEIARLLARYPLWGRGPDQATKPGEGPCPIGQCRSCWNYGRSEQRSERFKDACRWCGDFKSAHGRRPPLALWRIHHEIGKRVTTADLRRHAPELLPENHAS